VRGLQTPFGGQPLRVLDCKIEGCQEAVKDAPAAADFLDEGCKSHFEGLKKDLAALKIEFKENRRIVRGLDYYTRTVFEFLAADGLGSQNASRPAAATTTWWRNSADRDSGDRVRLGVERLAMLLSDAAEAGPEFFIVAMGPEAREQGIRLLARLRQHGRSADIHATAGKRA